MIDYGFNQVEIGGGDAWMKEPDIRNVLAGIKDLGATRVRLLAAWDFIEKSPGNYDTTTLTNLDRAINLSAEYGLAPLLLVSIGNARGGDGSATAYGNLCRMLATRYGPSGSNKVHAFEMWNEPNWSLFFSPVSAPTYVEFLRAGYTGIKAVHPTAKVITGGPATIGTGFGFGPSILPPFIVFANSQDPLTFIKGIIDAGALNYCDAIGFHWYSQNDAFKWEQPKAGQITWERLQDVHDYITAKGGTQKVWLTELGYAYPSIPSLTTCRDYLRDQVDLILANQDWIETFFYYSYRNTGTDTSNVVHQYGVVTFDYVKKQPLWDYVKSILGMSPGTVVRPDPPTGLAISARTSSTVTLTWSTTLLTPNPAAMVLSGRPPTAIVMSGGTYVPTGGALTLTGAAPTVIAGSPMVLTPAAGALTVTGHIPTVTAVTPITVTPTVGALTLTGAAPTVWFYRAHNDANLVADVDANSLSLSNTDPVSTITPTAGAETGALTQSGTNRPTFKTNAVNGLPALLFDGSNDSIRNTAWSRSYGPGYATDPTPVTVFLVALSTGADDTFYTGGASGVYLTAQRSTSSNLRMSAGDTTNFVTLTSVNASYHVYCHIFDSASSKHMMDQSTGGTTGTTGSGSNARLSGLRLGTNSSALGNFLDGEVARIIVVKGRVSDTNIAQEVAALGADYAISVT